MCPCPAGPPVYFLQRVSLQLPQSCRKRQMVGKLGFVWYLLAWKKLSLFNYRFFHAVSRSLETDFRIVCCHVLSTFRIIYSIITNFAAGYFVIKCTIFILFC